MNTLADLFVILLFLSAFFVVLSLACEVLERVTESFRTQPRRGRSPADRLPRRARVARPRRTPTRPQTGRITPTHQPLA